MVQVQSRARKLSLIGSQSTMGSFWALVLFSQMHGIPIGQLTKINGVGGHGSTVLGAQVEVAATVQSQLLPSVGLTAMNRIVISSKLEVFMTYSLTIALTRVKLLRS